MAKSSYREEGRRVEVWTKPFGGIISIGPEPSEAGVEGHADVCVGAGAGARGTRRLSECTVPWNSRNGYEVSFRTPWMFPMPEGPVEAAVVFAVIAA